jgi:hypothetical protein
LLLPGTMSRLRNCLCPNWNRRRPAGGWANDLWLISDHSSASPARPVSALDALGACHTHGRSPPGDRRAGPNGRRSMSRPVASGALGHGDGQGLTIPKSRPRLCSRIPFSGKTGECWLNRETDSDCLRSVEGLEDVIANEYGPPGDHRGSPENARRSADNRSSAARGSGPFWTAASASSNCCGVAIPTKIVPIAG